LFGKWAQAALIALLVFLAYLFAMNPGQVTFRIFPETTVRASLALVMLLTFATGFLLALLAGTVREAFRTVGFWRTLRREERRTEAHRLLQQGRGHALLGKLRLARKALRRAYRKMPDEPAISLELARTEAREGSADAAEKRLRKLLESERHNVEAYAALVEIAEARGDEESRRDALERWVELDPEYLPALQKLRDSHRVRGAWTDAVRVQEKVLARSEGREQRTRERRVLAEFLLAQARALPPEAAHKALQRAASEAPDFAPAHAALGEVLVRLGNEDGAAKAWLAGYQETGEQALLLKVEELRTRRGEAEEMLRLYKGFGRKDPATTLLRARLLLGLNRAEEALKLLGEAKRTGETPIGRWLVGEASFRLRSYDGASRAFRQALGAEDGPPPLGFGCGVCGTASRSWGESCPGCGRAGSLKLDLTRLPPPK
jgi:tetratricopeptide (TPR) repeat protein